MKGRASIGLRDGAARGTPKVDRRRKKKRKRYRRDRTGSALAPKWVDVSAELGRHGCGGWRLAARSVRPKRALPLGGLGGANRTSEWSDSPQWVERFAPAGGAIRPIPRQQGRTAVCHKWPCFLVNPALSGQNSRSRESLFEFGIIFARCLAEFLATVSPCGSTSAGSFITSPRPSPPRKERS